MIPVIGVADVRRYVRSALANQRRNGPPTPVLVPITANDESDTGTPTLRPMVYIPDLSGTGGCVHEGQSSDGLPAATSRLSL